MKPAELVIVDRESLDDLSGYANYEIRGIATHGVNRETSTSMDNGLIGGHAQPALRYTETNLERP